jgi:putative DNA primase/helicase
MTDAYTIARALRGVPVSGGWKCHCPVAGHGKGEGDRDRSLFVRDGDTPGRVLVTCYASCSREDIIEELRRQGLWPDAERRISRGAHRKRIERPPHVIVNNSANTAFALKIWDNSNSAEDSFVAKYLKSRAITLRPLPLTLRYRRRLKHNPSNSFWPAMVALVMNRDREMVAIHRTYLARDGSCKAPIDPAKMTLGPVHGGAVRLGPQSESLLVTEGIETALSVMQATGQVAWAALSATGIALLELPDYVRDVTICVDGDQTSEDAAAKATRRWLLQGRQVRVARPPPNQDFNDMLMEEVPDGSPGHNQQSGAVET